MDKKAFNTQVYNRRFEDKTVEWETKWRIAQCLKLIGKNKKVLDIGCYDGFITEKIKNYGNEVTGIELSKEGAKICRSRGIECVEQDLESKFPFEDNSFDVVFGGEIIEHIFDTDKLLQEIKRILKPNGHIVLSTPNIAALTRRLRLLLGINPHIDIGLISPSGKVSAGHIRYFTIKSMKELLKRNGLRVTSTKTDFILFNSLRLIKLGKLFPTLGWTFIVKAKPKI
jgi:methionine biosynthesis protein MetW